MPLLCFLYINKLILSNTLSFLNDETDQNFDVEGDSGIVARTYGTCVRIERKQNKLQNLSRMPSSHHMNTDSEREDNGKQRLTPLSIPEQHNRGSSSRYTIPDSHANQDDDEVQQMM